MGEAEAVGRAVFRLRLRGGALGAQAHDALGAEGGVDDEAVGVDVEGFVGVFCDEIRGGGAVELDQGVVELVACEVLGGAADFVDGR